MSALLDDRKANKLTEKIFNIYEDAKASNKRKVRSSTDDKDKDRESRKRLKSDDSQNQNSDKLTPEDVSIKNMLMYTYIKVFPA